MTKEEFIAAYCARSNMSWDDLKDWRVPCPCYCGDEQCDGWAMISPDSVERHMQTRGQPPSVDS